MENSPFVKLNSSDFYKGLLVFVGSAVITYLYQIVQGGFDNFDLNTLLQTAVSAMLAYLLKNVFTNSQGQFGKKEK